MYIKKSEFDEKEKEKKKSIKILDDKLTYDMSKINEDIFVQVIKEPFLGKGPRVTTEVSLAGNLIVLVPNQNYIGISKKINDKYERKRLKNIILDFKLLTLFILNGFFFVIAHIILSKLNLLFDSLDIFK